MLFSLRLLSILPAICLGFPLAIRFLLMLHEFATSEVAEGHGRDSGEDRLLLTEMMLATIWVSTLRNMHSLVELGRICRQKGAGWSQQKTADFL